MYHYLTSFLSVMAVAVGINGCNSLISLSSLETPAPSPSPSPSPTPTTLYSWNFTNSSLLASNFTYNNRHLDFDPANGVSLKIVDTEFNAASDFSRGVHSGTVFSGGRLTLQTSPTGATELGGWIPQSSNMVAYWRFNETVGATVTEDQGTAGLHGTASGVVFGGAGKLNAAATFDGTSSFISIPNFSDFGLMLMGTPTISFWFKSSDVANRMVALGAENSPTTTGYSIGFNQNQTGAFASGSCRVLLRNSSGSEAYNVFSCAASLDGNWHQMVVVNDGNTSAPTVYIDGAVVTPTSSASGVVGTFSALSTSLTMGAMNSAGTRSFYFNGQLDEMAILNGAYTATDVYHLYYGQTISRTQDLSPAWTPKWSNLVLYLKMDNSWDDTAYLNSTVTPAAGPTFVAGKIGTHAVSFDGTDDYATIPGNPAFDSAAHSVCVWLNPADPGANARIIEKGGYQIGGGYSITYGNRSIKLTQWALDGVTDCAVETNIYTVMTNLWTHVCATNDGTTSKIYINGENRASGACTSTANTVGFVMGKDNPSIEFYEGRMDDLAVWTTSLSDGDIKSLYLRQKNTYSGHYESPILDLGASTAVWTNLTSLTPLPFGKELPGASGNEASSTYPDIVDSTGATGSGSSLATSLEALWHFNETSGMSFADATGNGYDATANAAVSVGHPGLLDKGAFLTLNGNAWVDTPSINLGDHFTLSAWVNLDGNANAFQAVITNAGSGNDSGFKFHVNSWGTSDGRLRLETANGAMGATAETPVGLVLGDMTWYHLAVVVDRTAGTADLYINGVLSNPGNNTIRTDFKVVGPLRFGSMTDGNSNVEGVLDEVGVWTRELNAAEIFELYRRGGNRIYYQVRSCADKDCKCSQISTAPLGSTSDCSGNGTADDLVGMDPLQAIWRGANGAGSVFYSEVHNNASVNANGSPTGNVNLGSLNLDWSGGFFTAVGRPSANRYFQYRTFMESEANNSCGGSACLPEVSSITVGPTGRYYGGAPSIVNNTPLTAAEFLSFANSDDNACSKFQVSTDNGLTYRYWDGASWSLGLTSAQNNSATEISSHISTLSNSGNLKFKAFLNTNTAAGFSQSCTLQSISVGIPL